MPGSIVRELEGVHNFRPVAPYALRGDGRLRTGAIYRSGALDLMTAGDLAWLSAEVGVATILDLRHPEELGRTESAHGLFDRVVACSIFPEELGQKELIATLDALYGNGPSPERYAHYLEVGGPKFARAFGVFAEPERYPVLVHCTAGKDRTGVLLALVMEVLGVDDGDIAAEYALSDASIERLIAYLTATNARPPGTDAELRARFATPPERIAGFLRLLRAKHGSSESYLIGEGVAPAHIARARELLAE